MNQLKIELKKTIDNEINVEVLSKLRQEIIESILQREKAITGNEHVQ